VRSVVGDDVAAAADDDGVENGIGVGWVVVILLNWVEVMTLLLHYGGA